MFTTVFGNLTSLLPKSFIFGSFMPVVIFGFLNGALLYWSSATFREIAAPWLTGTPGIAIAVLFVAAVVAAYVISSLQNVMRRALEGAYGPWWLKSSLRADENKRKERLTAERNEARADASDVESADKWLGRLGEAASEAAKAPGTKDYATEGEAVHALVADLKARRLRWEPLHGDEIQQAVDGMVEAVKACRSDPALTTDRQDLTPIVRYAELEAPERERATFAARERAFGDDLPAATELGNIAAAMASYGRKRYNFDVDAFWGRLQPVIQQNDASSYSALLDAKTQLDFLIACWWFTVLTTIAWTVLFALAGDALVAALLTGPLGILGATILYRLAATAYASYAEFVRACIDLNRFALLRALHVQLPAGIRDERVLWTALSRVSSFGSSVVELSYQHGPPGS
ncbi:MAG TPA: hypothetical protein VHS78_20615 [Candidatus Elarobacter sp.]|jgi:hypothetical protein|nr:hypothetical protein [Candidatus Elarobacter sp.]